MRILFATFLLTSLIASATAQAPQTVASRLVVYRNPDYGPLTPQDIAAAQQCKDNFVAEASRLSQPYDHRRIRRTIELNAPTIEAAIVVAAAINICIAARGLEGLHVSPINISLGSPLLR